MAKLSAKLIGSIGESIAIKFLQGEGYELAVFGRDEYKDKSAIKELLPHLHRYWIGSSRANLAALQFSSDNTWIEGPNPSWADLTDDEITLLAEACRSSSICRMRDCDKKSAPCASPSKLFDRENLSKRYPKGVPVRSLNGVELKRSAMHFAYQCSARFSELLVADWEGDIVPRGKFMRDNELVSGYIQKVHERYSIATPLPYSGEDIRKAGMNTPAAEALKEINREAMRARAKDFPEGHPGRFDFVGMRSGELIAIEVKVNSSVPSYWQSLRLSLLNAMGHKTMLLKISATPDALKAFADSENMDGIKLDIQNSPYTDVDELAGYEFDKLANVPLMSY